MKNILVSKFLVVCGIIGSLQAVTIDPIHSLIFLPKPGNTVLISQPIIAGIMIGHNQKPLKNKPVAVYVDSQKVGIVKTNKDGVWSYKLNTSQKLQNGSHFAQAYITLGSTHYWSQSTIFSLHALRDTQNVYKSGNASVANSAIVFPFESSQINTATPTVVVNLLDSDFNAVSGETVALKIDSATVASPTSDSNGMASHMVTSLSDAAHTADAHCVQTSLYLTTINFVIDTVAPAAPTLTAPTENEIVSTSLVTVSGTTEADATITTFIDGDPYGDVSYADGSGNWAIEYELSNDAHSVTAQATDVAGNIGTVSTEQHFTVNA